MENFSETKSERTRRHIIESAAPLFNKKGYAGTSLSDLAAVTGLTKGALYANFRDKDDIALHAFHFNISMIQNSLTEEMAKCVSPYEKLRVFHKVYRRIYKEIVQNGGCPIANTLIDSDDTHPELHARALDVINGWEKLIMVLVKKGIKSKEIRSDVDPSGFARLMISLIEGASILTKSTGEESYIIYAIEHLERVCDSIQLRK